MGNGIDPVFILYGSTNTHGSRAFTGGNFIVQSVIELLVNEFFPVVGYIDKAGIEFHQRFNAIV